jgi:Bacterial transcriptional activator domain
VHPVIIRARCELRPLVSWPGFDRQAGYVLDVDPGAIDLHHFRRLRRQADALIVSGDHVGAALLLREAYKLWRGHALGRFVCGGVGVDLVALGAAGHRHV